ncbi:E3 ubiquitin-protein ligase RING1-like [Sesamum indicum]|uniref:E3 ubiquitin-protein ligase RING1-like n=1 Tax=Sesamum indicum TaxID=4182 RepID=A0A6I9TIF8_SESIN|nr:E3 ubiquitin-protein ligase RING1-like [Sesamum indicum]
MVSSVADLPPPLSFVCIIAVLIVYVICCYMVMDFLSQDEEDLTPFDQDSPQTPDHTSYSHFSVEELQEITCLYHGARASCSVCAICLENLQQAEVCRVLPACRHEFHAQCIDPWLSKRLNCPICRAPCRFRQSFRR